LFNHFFCLLSEIFHPRRPEFLSKNQFLFTILLLY
jgi:hypothetical protein